MTAAKVIALFFILTLFGCTEQPVAETAQSFSREQIFITLSDCWIGVDTEKDSVLLYERFRIDTVLRGDSTQWEKSRRISSVMSAPLSDSIAAACYRIVVDTANTDGHVTCYGGESVRILIKKGTADYSAKLNSVSKWQQASDSYRALFRLLDRNNLLPAEQP